MLFSVDSTGWEGEPTSVSVTTLEETICTAVDIDAIGKKSCAALRDEFFSPPMATLYFC